MLNTEDIDLDSTRETHDREVTMPEPKPGEQNYHSARRIFGLSAVMFWSIVPLLVIALVLILFFAL
jgi:hypothetical protein